MKGLLKKQIMTVLETRAEIERQSLEALVSRVAHKDCPTDLGICGRVAWHRNEIDFLRATLTAAGVKVPEPHRQGAHHD